MASLRPFSRGRMKLVGIGRFKYDQKFGELESLMESRQATTTAIAHNLLILLKSSGREVSSSAALFRSVMGSSLLSMECVLAFIPLKEITSMLTPSYLVESKVLRLRVFPCRQCNWPICVSFDVPLLQVSVGRMLILIYSLSQNVQA